MNNEHMDETFRELQNELALVPSPEFAAKVRARVAADPARRWSMGWSLAAAAAGISLVTGAWLFVSSNRVTVVPQIAAVQTFPAPAVVPLPEPAAVPRIQPDPAPSRVRATSVPADDPATPPAVAGTRAEYDVLVPADQGIAVAAYMAQLRAGRVTVPAASSAPATSNAAVDGVTPKPIELIEISPIVVDLLPGTKAMLGGGSRR